MRKKKREGDYTSPAARTGEATKNKSKAKQKDTKCTAHFSLAGGSSPGANRDLCIGTRTPGAPKACDKSLPSSLRPSFTRKI